jgi:hypothetical protein
VKIGGSPPRCCPLPERKWLWAAAAMPAWARTVAGLDYSSRSVGQSQRVRRRRAGAHLPGAYGGRQAPLVRAVQNIQLVNSAGLNRVMEH